MRNTNLYLDSEKKKTQNNLCPTTYPLHSKTSLNISENNNRLKKEKKYSHFQYNKNIKHMAITQYFHR